MTASTKGKFKFAQRLQYVPKYIFAKLDADKQVLAKKGIDVIDLSIGSPNLPTPQAVKDECIKAINEPTNSKYPPFSGQKRFKEEASKWLKRRFGVDMDPETEVFPLSGSKEGIAHLAWTMIEPGDVTIVSSPYYPVHARGTLLAGGEIYELPMLQENNYIVDLDSIPADILKRAKMLFLSYPNNPTGAVCDISLFEKAVALCKKHEILLISDLAYSEITFDGKVAPSVFQVEGAKDIAVEFHTFSKTYSMAGWRMGFITGNAEVVAASYEIKTNTDYGVCNITQQAATAAFTIPDEERKKTAEIYQKRRDIIVSGLKKLGWDIPTPEGAMYIWIPIPKGYKDCFEFCSDLLNKAHVASIPGGSFGTYGEGYIRFALVDDEDRLEEAIKRMEKAGIRFS